MRRTLPLLLGVAGVAALTVLSACNGPSGTPPRPGETVMPQLSASIHWTAGRPGQLGVRLVARGQDGSAERTLGFAAVATDVHPVASVTFFTGEQSQPPVTVPLDHRC
jgi:hypothetical protein